MAKKQSIPRRLFKYRAFNNLTLDMIIADNLFWTNPLRGRVSALSAAYPLKASQRP